jgi:hypothetical protein
VQQGVASWDGSVFESSHIECPAASEMIG